jgi:hypothetical protein
MVDKPFDPDAYLAKEEEKPPEKTWGDTAMDVVRAVPQTTSDMLRVGGNSATYGQWDRARAVGEVLTGGAPSYAEALQDKVARSQAARERLGPFLAGTADAVGGLATGSTLAKAGGMATGAAVNAGKALWQRMGIGALEGGAHGAAQATGHTYSDKPGDYVQPAVTGFGLGSILGTAAPVAGAVGGVASKAHNQIFPAELSKAADADRAGLMELMLGRKGPRGMLPDTGPSMLGTAQGSVPGTSGPGKSALVTNLTDRNNTSARTITGEVDRNLGRTAEPSVVDADIAQNMRVRGAEYQPLLQNARAIDTQGIADRLTEWTGNLAGERLRTVQAVRQALEIPGNPGVLDPHPVRIHAVRSSIKDQIRDPATPPATREQLEHIDELLTRELQAKVPGIRELDSHYAELGTQRRAADSSSAGGSIFDTGQQQVMRPYDYQNTITEGVQPKGTNVGPSAETFRLSQAARAEIDRILGTKGDDLRALELTLGKPHDWNSQKLVQMFGQERADAVQRVIRNERQFRDTYQDVVKGSQTAARLEAAKAQEASSGKLPGDKTIWGRVEQAGQWGLNALREKTADATRDKIASIMATNDPARLQILAQQLMASEPDKRARAAIVEALVAQGVLSGGAGLASSQGGVKKKQPLPAGY